MKKITASLISSIKFNRDNPEKLKEIITGTKFITTPEQQKGIDFENDLAILNGNKKQDTEIKIDEWYNNKKTMYDLIKGSVWQQKVEKIIKTNDDEYLLKGFMDFYNEEKKEIIDIKTTKNYQDGEMKFFSSVQHLIYFECTPATNFKYLINSWNDSSKIYIEEYNRKENNLERIISAINLCKNILNEYNLYFNEIK